MKTLFTILLILVTFQMATAQTKPQLELQKGSIKKGTETLSMKQALDLMENYPDAYAYMKKARTNSSFAQVFAFAGGWLIGTPIGQSIAGGDANWSLAGIGAGVILVAIPFVSASKKNASMSIDLYNAAEYKALNNNVELKVGMLENGIGLRVSF